MMGRCGGESDSWEGRPSPGFVGGACRFAGGIEEMGVEEI